MEDKKKEPILILMGEQKYKQLFKSIHYIDKHNIDKYFKFSYELVHENQGTIHTQYTLVFSSDCKDIVGLDFTKYGKFTTTDFSKCAEMICKVINNFRKRTNIDLTKKDPKGSILRFGDRRRITSMRNWERKNKSKKNK